VPPTLPGTPAPARSATEPFTYFVQAGAYSRTEEAEQQRARLAMLGYTARITEREQAGRTVYRVRVGPFEQKDQADAARVQLDGSGVEAALVRVQR
jgi:cell division protein FtsN